MLNLKLVEDQPRWRVAVVHYFAKLMGVCIHVEGIPFGSARCRRQGAKASGEMGAVARSQEGQIIGAIGQQATLKA